MNTLDLPELNAFDFELPENRIARFPPETRDGGRLLIVHEGLTDATFSDLPGWLRPGDLLVLNDVRVRKARLFAKRHTGGTIEVMLAGSAGLDTPNQQIALLRPARRLNVGERLQCGSGQVELLECFGDGRWRVACWPDARSLEEEVGQIPLPPYLNREPTLEDAVRYQTVYASERSGFAASAAPTAGLHLTEAMLTMLEKKDISIARVALEVGLGTFQPLTRQHLDTGQLHQEYFDVPEDSWDKVEMTRKHGGRVVAIGTTSARVLESVIGPGRGSTRLFIQPGYKFQRVNVLFTNFHLPRSSLLMLVCAFGGHPRIMSAYQHALEADYRFFSYGDAMLLFPLAS